MTIEKTKAYLEALGTKLYNHKFTLPPIPSSSERTPCIMTSSKGEAIKPSEICLELVFRLPHYGDVSFGYLEYHPKIDPKDSIALFIPSTSLTVRINACVVDPPQQPQDPRAGSGLLWDDFTAAYFDPDVGCDNPVDQKVIQVGAVGGRES